MLGQGRGPAESGGSRWGASKLAAWGNPTQGTQSGAEGRGIWSPRARWKLLTLRESSSSPSLPCEPREGWSRIQGLCELGNGKEGTPLGSPVARGAPQGWLRQAGSGPGGAVSITQGWHLGRVQTKKQAKHWTLVTNMLKKCHARHPTS